MNPDEQYDDVRVQSLDQVLTNVFCKGLDSTYFELYGTLYLVQLFKFTVVARKDPQIISSRIKKGFIPLKLYLRNYAMSQIGSVGQSLPLLAQTKGIIPSGLLYTTTFPCGPIKLTSCYVYSKICEKATGNKREMFFLSILIVWEKIKKTYPCIDNKHFHIPLQFLC